MEVGEGQQRVFDVLEESVCTDPDIEFVLAFGSRAAGEPTEASDLDLAVKFADELSDHARFEKQCFLAGDLQRDGGPFVDLSDIEALPLAVRYDAVNGSFVCGNRQAFERFKADIEATFAEERESLRRRQRAIIDRIAEDGLRG